MTVSPCLHATLANVCKWVSTEFRRCGADAVKTSKNRMWYWQWCVPIQEQIQSKCTMVVHNSWQWSVLVGGVCLTDSSWARQKLEPVHSVFPAWCTGNGQTRWVCGLMMVCTVISKNLKPNPAPARCWCTMPQVDSGLCKLCGRANEN